VKQKESKKREGARGRERREKSLSLYLLVYEAFSY